jgi:lysophospholipase L1-like esterase
VNTLPTASTSDGLPCESQPDQYGNGVVSSRWSFVTTRTVYFGHQSRGSGVVAGVEGLTQEHALPLRVVQTREPATISGPAFVHFFAGQSRDFASKNASVLRLLESPTRARRPVVLLKYCYGDINCSGDAATMFGAYRDTVETIQFEHPDVTVVHATVPLLPVESALESGARQFFGRPTRREHAIARQRYNELVRAEFADTEPIFDIAKVEATQPDGTLAGFSAGGRLIETLARHNTDDGSHLNARCQRAAAEELLDVLSDAIEAAP